MKTKIALLLIVCTLLGLSPSLHAQKLKKFVEDPNYSSIIFVISHLKNGRINGSFRNFNIKMETTQPDFSDAKLVLTIEANSIITHNAKRDSVVKSVNFLNVQNNPIIKFESERFEKLSEGFYNVHGNLTMKKTTLPTVMSLEFKGVEWDPEIEKHTAIFLMQNVINGPDWGIKPYLHLNGILGNYMNLIIDFEMLEEESVQ